ncbi:unnamed protein product [Cyclocybe aegerita]|uniref:Chitin synthase n=1 Tax=Cyclocybe aegerita TaxID=1973307 RepID=A0A8S0WJ84_CYCAE|nr:unnamed protein product [Cyclocybe aegerita]
MGDVRPSGVAYQPLPGFSDEEQGFAEDRPRSRNQLAHVSIPSSSNGDISRRPLQSFRSALQISSPSSATTLTSGHSPLGLYSPITPYLPGTTFKLGCKHRESAEKRYTKSLSELAFVVECPLVDPVLSPIVAEKSNSKNTEFTHLRYTAATCDPDDFTVRNGYTLRGQAFSRSTDILIAITSFNEGASMYAHSLSGVFANSRDLCTSQKSRYWRSCAGEAGPAWQRITVALVVDGLEEMDGSALEFLTGAGLCQPGVMRPQVDGAETTAHIFESLIPAKRLDKESQLSGHSDDIPIQFILIIKAKNERKISSHRWVLNSIAKNLNPEICIFLDAGTKPGPKAIYRLWDAFHNDPHLGGASGQIHTPQGRMLLNPLVAAQNFEYKTSSVFDRPLESTFGHVVVLPGAFSAYRYRAILGRPLEEYFKGDHSMANRLGIDGMRGMSIFQKNLYLAEDRILSFELVAKEGEKWTTAYIRSSTAETDVPENPTELLSQRRRWLNGALAANFYALANFGRFYRTTHGWRQLALFHLQAICNLASMVFSWFTLANLWLAFSILLDSLPGYAPSRYMFLIAGMSKMIKGVYLLCLLMQFLLAFGNRPRAERIAYDFTLCFFGFVPLYLMFMPALLSWLSAVPLSPSSIENADSTSKSAGSALAAVFGPMGSTPGITLITSLLYLDFPHLVHSSIQYICMGPSIINVLTVYAYCNLHDVSWGTKGCDQVEILTPCVSSSKLPTQVVMEAKRSSARDNSRTRSAIEDAHKSFRTRVVTFWISCNIILAVAVESYGGWLNLADPSITAEQVRLFYADKSELRNAYLAGLGSFAYWLVLLRFVGSVIFWARSNMSGWWRRNS